MDAFVLLFACALSCNTVILRFLYAVAYVHSSFLFIADYHHIVYPLTYLWAYRLFLVVTTMNKTAVNICV